MQMHPRVFVFERRVEDLNEKIKYRQKQLSPTRDVLYVSLLEKGGRSKTKLVAKSIKCRISL
jgi:hypothetical protein